MNSPELLAAMKGTKPLELDGKPLTAQCLWCGNPTTNVASGECGMCHELKILMSTRPGVAVKMLGRFTNTAASLVEVVGGISILPKGFPEGMYEGMNFSTKEEATKTLTEFGNQIRDNICMHLVNKMLEIGLGALAPEPQQEPKIILSKGE